MQLQPHRRALLGPAAAEAVEAFRRPSLPAGIRYALLLRQPDRPKAKPLAFRSAADLARALHRRRAGGALQLLDAQLTVHESATPKPGVSVWTLDPSTGDRRHFLGWAYLGGAGRRSLEDALQQIEPGPVH